MTRVWMLMTLLSACTSEPKFKQEDVVNALLAKDRGLIAGYDLGDSWTTIKAEHDSKLYQVRDDEGTQLRHDLSDYGQDGWFIGFELEGDTVARVTAVVRGRSANAVVVRKAANDIMSHFDKKIGNGSCRNSAGKDDFTCSWKMGGKYVALSYRADDQPLSSTIELELVPRVAEPG